MVDLQSTVRVLVIPPKLQYLARRQCLTRVFRDRHKLQATEIRLRFEADCSAPEGSAEFPDSGIEGISEHSSLTGPGTKLLQCARRHDKDGTCHENGENPRVRG